MDERDDDPDPQRGRRDDDDGEEMPEDSDVYLLDLDDAESVDADRVAREALEAVEKVERASGEMRLDELRREVAEEEAAPTISRLEEELAELRDRSVRTLADFENYRRRSERERDEVRRYALTEALRDLLPVVDNLERALAAGGTVEDLKTGVEMILRQLRDLLRQRGVVEIAAQGLPFDPAQHEAVAREEQEGVAVPTVVEEMQRGYRLHERLLRPALVRVAVPVAGREGGET
jgi:molecular chaperone GrpE